MSNDTSTTPATNNERSFRSSILGKFLYLYTQYMGIGTAILLSFIGFITTFKTATIIGTCLSATALIIGYIYYKIIDPDLDPNWPKFLDLAMFIVTLLLTVVAYLLPESFARYWTGVINNAALVIISFLSVLVKKPLVRSYVPDYRNKDARIVEIYDYMTFYNTIVLSCLLTIPFTTEMIVALTQPPVAIEVIVGKVIPISIPFVLFPTMTLTGQYLWKKKAREVLGPNYRDIVMDLWNDNPPVVGSAEEGGSSGLSEPLLPRNNAEQQDTSTSEGVESSFVDHEALTETKEDVQKQQQDTVDDEDD